MGQATDLAPSNQLLSFDVLNCPAVAILDFQRERVLAGRVEVGEDQVGVVSSGLLVVPEKDLSGKVFVGQEKPEILRKKEGKKGGYEMIFTL